MKIHSYLISNYYLISNENSISTSMDSIHLESDKTIPFLASLIHFRLVLTIGLRFIFKWSI